MKQSPNQPATIQWVAQNMPHERIATNTQLNFLIQQHDNIAVQ